MLLFTVRAKSASRRQSYPARPIAAFGEHQQKLRVPREAFEGRFDHFALVSNAMTGVFEEDAVFASL